MASPNFPPNAIGNQVSGGPEDAYFYSPLPEHGTIRLLRLTPHQDREAPIECQLFEYPLRKARQGVHMYEALSYVWGSEEDQKPIYIRGGDESNNTPPSLSTGNNRRLLVTKNLHAALSHLRDDLLDRIMWIDAICINQKDNVEKGRQVQFMAEIYANANRVTIWLGEASSDSGEAFEALRKAARDQHPQHTIDEPTQQAIFTLLERPWFQRIWVVQEAAAARHILMKCGPDEVDGFAFCSGLTAMTLSYTARPDLQGLILPMSYLIRDAILRPRCGTNQPETSQPSTFSLNIHPLGELVDMYHARKATNRLDKVYALLGMSSDNPRTAGLLADYNLPWGGVFRNLIQFILSDQLSVDTWDHCAVAVIQGKGHICGRVENARTRGNVQRITIAWKNARGHFGQTLEEVSRHDFRASAAPIRVGDAVCLLQGAPKPIIVRFQNAYSAVIMITVPLGETYKEMDQETLETTSQGWLWHLSSVPTSPTGQEWWRVLSSISTSPTDLVMIWDWDASQRESQDGDYESFIKSRGTSLRPWTESQDYFVKAIRSLNLGILLNGIERYEDAAAHIQKAVEAYAIALTSTGTSPDYGAWTAADEEALMAVNDLVIGDKGTFIVTKTFDGQLPLFWATEKGHERLVKLLLDKGADIDVQTSTGFTPLFCAMEKGHERIVQLLLDKGAILDRTTSALGTRLEWAAEQGHVGVVRWLLNNNMNLDTHRNSYDKALWVACRENHDKIVQQLLENGADVDTSAGHYENTLLVASTQGHNKVVQMLLENGADIHTMDANKTNGLLAATFAGHDKTVQLLIAKGADVNAPNSRGVTPLQIACNKGYTIIVQMLLEWGADVNAGGGTYSGSVLQAASAEGHDGIVQMLLERGASVNVWGGVHDSALRAASVKGHNGIVQMLLEWGADVNGQVGMNSDSTLQAASAEGHDGIVRMLLERGASVNAWGGVHGSALRAASVKGHNGIVQILLEWGADVNAGGGTYTGSVLQAASAEGHDGIVQMLLERGASVNVWGGVHGSALRAASVKGHNGIVQMLLEWGADVNAQGGTYGGSVLQAASAKGLNGIYQMLLDSGATW